MNFRIGRIFGVLCVVFAISAVLSLPVFSETLNSNVFTAEQKNTFEDFRGKTLETTANLNWQTSNGSKITKTTVKNLPSYLLTVNAAEGQEKATFVSTPKNPLDVSGIGRLYFVVQYADDEKAEYTVTLTLSDGTDSLVCAAPLKGNSRQLVSFEVGFFTLNRKISELSLGFSSDTDGGKVSVSGPYYVDSDRTHADSFALEDISLSPEAVFADGGIFIADSTLKTGFSGRLWRRTGQSVNHLRLFVTTGELGGILEIRYSYFNEANGNLATKSVNVELKNKSANDSYIVPLEYADKIVSLTFLFDVSRSGGITVHRIEAVDIYMPSAQKRYGEISQCVYGAGEGTVTVKGNIFHDFLIKHANYTLYLYRLDTSEDLQEAIAAGKKPVKSAKMSSEFKMIYNAGRQDKLAALALYSVVASDGTDFVEILPPFHIDQKKGSTDVDTVTVKGLCAENLSDFTSMGVGVSTVDVYLDRLVGEKKSGYIYSLGETHVYFDSDYVHSLDKQIKKLCVAGCSVYLRLLVGDGDGLAYAAKVGDDAQSYVIDVSGESAKAELFAAVDFLTRRYSDHTNGSICGYIFGRVANVVGDTESISAFTEKLAAALEAVALSVSVSMSDARIILPISTDGGYDVELLLHSLCNRLAEPGGLDLTIMIESSRNYFKGDMLDAVDGFDMHLLDVEKLVGSLAETFASVRDGYFYLWTPDPSNSDEQLKAAYVYMYMSLLTSRDCESFLLSTNRSQDSELIRLVKYIDTTKNKNGELTDFVLDMLEVESWNRIVDGFSEEKYPLRSYEESSENVEIAPAGTYALFNFSSSFSSLGWFAGYGCSSLTMTSRSGEKSLCAVMENYDGQAEISYHFDVSENLGMAPYLAFDFLAGAMDKEKYSVAIIVRSGKDVFEASGVFLGGEKNRFCIDIGSVADSVDSLSICVSALDGTSDNYEFKLFGVSVISEYMTDKELSAAIDQARAQAGMLSGDGEKAPDYEFAIVLVGILAVSVIVAGIYDRNKEK